MVCVCVWVRRERGQKVVCFCVSRVFFFCFSFLLHIFFSPLTPRDRGGRMSEGGREVGGVTTDVLPPSESCLFDGDSGAYHVA